MHHNCPALQCTVSVSVFYCTTKPIRSDLSEPVHFQRSFNSIDHLFHSLRRVHSQQSLALKKKRAVLSVIAGYSGKRLGPKLAWLGRIIRSLAFNVMRQRASEAPLVSKNICALFGSSDMVLEEAKSARHRVLRI